MKDIFSELYKKVLSFFNQEQKEENSKDTACNRLKLVLMQDRAKMEPALMEKMREEMIEVISKYVEIDKEALDLNLEAEGESFALMLNIPVLRAKTREEVEAAEGIIDDDDDDEEILEEEETEDETEEEIEDNTVETVETSNVSDDNDSTENEEKQEEKQKIEIIEEDEIVIESDLKEVKEDVPPIKQTQSSQKGQKSSKKKSKQQKDNKL